jgi:uncharacterized protein (TIGR00297 family)
MRCIENCAASGNRTEMTTPLFLASFIQTYPSAWSLVVGRVMLALAISLAFSLLAWGMRAVTGTGAVAGAVITFVICIAAGPDGFGVLLSVFLLTMFATRFGLHRKLEAGLAERNSGRDAGQILANLLAATMVAAPVAFLSGNKSLLLAGMTAAFCEAAADTVSSEIGQATGRRAYLITSLRSVPAGTDGAISATGSIAGVLAAIAIGAMASWLNVLRSDWWLIAVGSGIAGTVLDSLLGATLERDGRLGNNAVNFLSSTFAACLTLAIGLWKMV